MSIDQYNLIVSKNKNEWSSVFSSIDKKFLKPGQIKPYRSPQLRLSQIKIFCLVTRNHIKRANLIFRNQKRKSEFKALTIQSS